MPTLTPQVNDTEPPRVDVFFAAEEFPAGTVSVTVIQTSEVGQMEVRGAIRRPVGAGFFVTDYETPIGRPVSYRGQPFNASGAPLALTAAASTELPADPGVAIFQDPLAPRSWVAVTAEAKFADTLVRSRSSALHRRGPVTVGLMGELGLLEGVSLRAVTRTAAQSARMARVLAEGTVLVRTPPGMTLPPCLTVLVASPREVPFNARWGGEASVWDITGDEITRSLLDIVESPLTWARYRAAYPTWAAMRANYATWNDAKRNPPPEL